MVSSVFLPEPWTSPVCAIPSQDSVSGRQMLTCRTRSASEKRGSLLSHSQGRPQAKRVQTIGPERPPRVSRNLSFEKWPYPPQAAGFSSCLPPVPPVRVLHVSNSLDSLFLPPTICSPPPFPPPRSDSCKLDKSTYC